MRKFQNVVLKISTFCLVVEGGVGGVDNDVSDRIRLLTGKGLITKIVQCKEGQIEIKNHFYSITDVI